MKWSGVDEVDEVGGLTNAVPRREAFLGRVFLEKAEIGLGWGRLSGLPSRNGGKGVVSRDGVGKGGYCICIAV